MTCARSLICLLIALLVLSADRQVAAQAKKPSNKQDEKRENEAVKDAQEALQDARDKLKDAEKSLGGDQDRLRKAVAARTSAGKDIEKVQDRLETEHGERTGLTAARKKLKDVQAEYDRTAKPVLERVKAEQQPLLARIEKARQGIKPDGNQPDGGRSAAAAEYAQLTKQLRELERKALEADPTTKPLLQRVDDAEAAVQAALKKFETAIERDGDFKAAQKAFEQAKREVGAAETAIARSQKAVAEARSRVAQAQQKLQQKQAADAKDDNKPNRKKKGK